MTPFSKRHTPGPESRAGAYGIVDIGSNSVRLVVYAAAARSPVPIFNEKVMAGLGRTIVQTGRLDPQGIERAFAALRRFAALKREIGIKRLDVVATAAVREAADGPDFLKEAEKLIRQAPRLLSGEEEAHFAAQGVLSGIPDADGLVGDLGGGSLELISVADGQMRPGITLPLGPLRLEAASEGNFSKASDIVDDCLKQVEWLPSMKGRPFYAVGGVWRNLARIHMAQHSYPVRVLHHYAVPLREAMQLTGLIEKMGPKSLSKIPDISSRRVPALPFGALVMERLLVRTGASEVIVSSFGLREGVLFDGLDGKEQRKDPLIEGCLDLSGRLARFPEHGDELAAWTAELFGADGFGEVPAQKRLRLAACILADIGWYVHPDYRAHHAMEQILLAPVVGINHPGRMFLARVGYHRHEGSAESEVLGDLTSRLDPQEAYRARVLGLTLRLAFSLCAARLGVIPHTRLRMTEKTVRLEIPKKLENFMGETVQKRLSALAKAAGREAEVVIG